MSDRFRSLRQSALALAPVLFVLSAPGCNAASRRASTPAATRPSGREKTAAIAEPAMPFTPTAADLQSTGQKLFLKSCAHCHGADARGDEGPDLHELELSDRRIAAIIQHGIKGEMPSFAKKHSAADIAALTAYLRTLE